MRRIAFVASIACALTVLVSGPSSAQQTKTAAQCNADYAANKAAIKAAKVKKKDFVASCRAGNEVIPGAAAAPPAQTATPAPAPPPPAVTPAPVAPKPSFFGRKKAAPAPAPTPTAAPAPPPAAAPAPTATAVPTGANQFQAAAQAQGRCPGGLVVWVNIKSRVYHFPSSRNYGTTKDGAYMCETDATAAGDRASKTEKRP